jgi:serine/threonine protein kinase
VTIGLPNRVRFGAFELDLQSGELCSCDANGERLQSRIVLPEQPLRLLTMLIEREGAMVTREEIQKRFWPNDTIVEFDHSINVAIGKLRKALGDSADKPQYIATIARRGYRLMVPVTRIEAAQPAPANVAPVVESPGVPGQLSHAAVLTGQIVSHYRVLDIIGGGGMGVVYRAEDLKLGRRVAIKFLPDETASDTPTLLRFEREAQTASSLNHPNICTVYEFGEHKGQPFLVMELLQGETLRDRLAATDGTGLPLDELLEIALQITKGLQAAHHQGIIHRDIKPANIFLADHDVCKILDFGLAKMLERPEPETATFVAREPHPNFPARATVSLVGQVMGTAGYMSPEQAQGKELDARTDLFSLGAVLYEMATGQMPFRTEKTSDVFDAILNRVPLSPAGLNPNLPAALGRIIERALEKDREQRYQSAAEMRTELQQLKRDSESGRAPAASTDRVGTAALGRPAERSSAASARESASRAGAPAPHEHVELRSTGQPRSTLSLRSHAQGRPGAGIPTWAVAVSAVVLITLAAGGFYYYRSHRAKALTEKDTIVLTDFANSTGDAIFDDTLKTALTISLQQSPFLNVLSSRDVTRTLKEMARPAGSKLTPELARELCQRAESKAYIAGAIGSLGSKYVLELKAVNCQSGQTLAEEQATASSKEKVLNALGEAASKLRGKLGESLATVQRFDLPLLQETTTSFDALKAFSMANRTATEKGMAAGLPGFQRAIEIDPNFAIGYATLGQDYMTLGEVDRASKYLTKAFQVREHASEREKLEITAMYYSTVTGELDKGVQTYQEEIENFPLAGAAYGNSAGLYAELGQYEKAAWTQRGGKRAPSVKQLAYQNLANFALGAQNFDEARQMVREGLSRRPNDFILHNAAYALAFLSSDSAAMGEQQKWFASNEEYLNFGLALASDTEAYGGRLRKALVLSQQAANSAIRTDNKETGAIYKANAAIEAAAYGDAAQSRQLAAEALKLAPTSLGAGVEAALAFAVAGETTRAQTLVQDLDRRFALDTQMQSLWLPAIKGELALDANNPSAAISALASASTIEFGQFQFLNNLSCLYHTYIRGEAYLSAGQGKEAAAEFQKILDHPGIVWNCWTGALAHLGKARANALQAGMGIGSHPPVQNAGRVRKPSSADSLAGAPAPHDEISPAERDAARVRALAAYKDFLALWKDADADIPILKQAKAEYAKLQ